MALDKEIIDGFKEESTELLTELVEVVEKLAEPTSDFPADLLAEYAQKVDRIMGAAKTMLMMEPEHLGLQRISGLTEICKRLGYSAAKSGKKDLVPIFAAFWADTLDVIEELLENLENLEKTKSIFNSFSKILINRLSWLSKKVGTSDGLPPSEVKSKEAAGGQVDIDQLMSELGF